MQREKTKVRPRFAASKPRRTAAPRRSPLVLCGLLLSLLLLGSSCQRQLNQRDGRYYSARDMARLKRGERVGRAAAPRRAPAPRATVKTKMKTKAPAGTTVAEAGGALVARPPAPRRVLRASTATGVMAAAIEAARGYQGTPYRYGGTTRDGLDCSALLQLSFAEAGVSIPRSSNEQAAWGEPVKPTELRPGDFLFFGAAPGSGTITHVGLVTVVDSEGVEFIHASTSLGVVENGFESDYYLSRFIRAVRPRLTGGQASGGTGE